MRSLDGGLELGSWSGEVEIGSQYPPHPDLTAVGVHDLQWQATADCPPHANHVVPPLGQGGVPRSSSVVLALSYPSIGNAPVSLGSVSRGTEFRPRRPLLFLVLVTHIGASTQGPSRARVALLIHVACALDGWSGLDRRQRLLPDVYVRANRHVPAVKVVTERS